jgi:hypothetical protein
VADEPARTVALANENARAAITVDALVVFLIVIPPDRINGIYA